MRSITVQDGFSDYSCSSLRIYHYLWQSSEHCLPVLLWTETHHGAFRFADQLVYLGETQAQASH